MDAKCENCGTIFTLGVDGVTTDNGSDLCDGCSHTVRGESGYVLYDPMHEPDEPDETYISIEEELARR